MMNLPAVGVMRDQEQLWLNPKIAFKKKILATFSSMWNLSSPARD